MARRYDLVIFQAYSPDQSTPDQIKRLKRLNPNLKILLYYHVHGQWDWQRDWTTITSHDDWFVRDSEGRRIKAGPGADWWLMNLGSPEYRNYVRQRILNTISQYSFDGLMEDGPFPTLRGLWPSWSRPIPESVKRAWHGWAITYVKEMKAALGAKLYITNTTPWAGDNSIPDWGDDYFLAHVDGTMMEGFAHACWQSHTQMIDEPWWRWQQSKYQRNLDHGKIVYMLSGVNSRIDEERRRWQLFSFGSYLLRADGARAYYNWHYQGYFNEMDAKLSLPLGPSYEKDGTYQRDFAYGEVVVNASNRVHTTSLLSSFPTITRDRISIATLAPSTALILVR